MPHLQVGQHPGSLAIRAEWRLRSLVYPPVPTSKASGSPFCCLAVCHTISGLAFHSPKFQGTTVISTLFIFKNSEKKNKYLWRIKVQGWGGLGWWGWRLGGVLASVVLSGGAEAWDLQARSSRARPCPVPAGRSGGSASLACPWLPGRALRQQNPHGD